MSLYCLKNGENICEPCFSSKYMIYFQTLNIHCIKDLESNTGMQYTLLICSVISPDIG